MDGGEASGYADIGVNDAPNLETAAEGDYKEETVGEGDYVEETAEMGDYVGEAVEGCDYVGEAVDGRAEAPSDPGPFSEDVSMDDFLPRPRLGSVFLTFSDAAGDEVILLYVGILR